MKLNIKIVSIPLTLLLLGCDSSIDDVVENATSTNAPTFEVSKAETLGRSIYFVTHLFKYRKVNFERYEYVDSDLDINIKKAEDTWELRLPRLVNTAYVYNNVFDIDGEVDNFTHNIVTENMHYINLEINKHN